VDVVVEHTGSHDGQGGEIVALLATQRRGRLCGLWLVGVLAAVALAAAVAIAAALVLILILVPVLVGVHKTLVVLVRVNLSSR